MARFHRGNSFLKGRNVKIDWTPELIQEYLRCKDDIVYFVENYFKIVTGKGLELMKLRDYQREMIRSMECNRFTLAVMARQSGKTECFRAFLLHYLLFNEYKTVAVVANKESMAVEIVGKIQTAYINLPSWLQQGIVDYNKSSFVLENNCRIFASATSKDALRGFAVHMIVIDEAAHIDNWDEFYGAVAPTISASDMTKMVMASTPKGLNHFHDFYQGSNIGTGKTKGTNGFYGLFVDWKAVPGRDEKWYQETMGMLGWDYIKFDQEYNCSFIGSSGTLINGTCLEALKKTCRVPMHEVGNLKIYSLPVKESKVWQREEIEVRPPQLSIYDRPERKVEPKLVEVTVPADKYAIVADVARGKGLDYSAFSVFNISRVPYEQVATFKSNDITPTDYAKEIYQVARMYNEAQVLAEINDIGEQVSTYLMEELEYESVLCTQNNGRAGKSISFNLAKSDKGVRTTLPLKNSGCLLLKLLLEERKLEVWDEDTVNELLVFSRDKNTWKAEEGKHDDLVMTLVLFAWFTDQKFFLEWTSLNTMSEVSQRSLEEVENRLANFFYVSRNGQASDMNGAPVSSYVENLNLPFKPIRDPFERYDRFETEDNPDGAIWLPNF